MTHSRSNEPSEGGGSGNAASAAGSSGWGCLADLEVRVEGLELLGREQGTASKFRRLTTEFHLLGGGHRGRGEDVGYAPDAQLALQAAGPPRALLGRWTLGELDELLAGPRAPELGPAVSETDARYRRWAVESAALDLALRQAGRGLGELLGRTAQPVNWVVSLGLGEPPDLERLRALRRAFPRLGFKLDAGGGWSDELIAELHRLGGVDVVDLKGCYAWTAPLPDEVQERVAVGLPGALLEDPHLTEVSRERLGAHRDRITWDAPLHAWSDVESRPWPPRWINVKPSRFGSLRALFEVYARAQAAGIACYGGGQFELGVGRAQVQLLASLFHPEAPNDVSPVAFHAAGVPSGVAPPPLSLTTGSAEDSGVAVGFG